MSFEIRQAKAEEMAEFTQLASSALVMNPNVAEGLQPEHTLCGFEDGRMSTSYAVWPLSMRFNGGSLPFAGVTCVGTRPVNRRRGQLRQIKKLHFESLHEQGERPVAVLWASMAAIYQRFGYGIISTQASYEVEPRYLGFALPGAPEGNYRESSENELPLLKVLYDKFIERRTGYIERTDLAWQQSVLPAPPEHNYRSIIVYEEAGRPLGYIIYTVGRRGGTFREPPRLMIRELVWNSPSAYRALWSHLGHMDLIGNIVCWRFPVDDPLPHLLLEPRKLNRRTSDGMLARIIDVDKALTSRRYSAEGSLTFEVKDGLCPWNEGRWRLEAHPDGATVKRYDGEPQLTMPVSTLAMLAFGQVSATEAFRMGRLDAGDPAALPAWDSVMRTDYRPASGDGF